MNFSGTQVYSMYLYVNVIFLLIRKSSFSIKIPVLYKLCHYVNEATIKSIFYSHHSYVCTA